MNFTKKLLILLIVVLGISEIITANPVTKWTFTTGGPVYSSPACFNGNVYIGSDDGILYCLNAVTGAKKWEFKTGGIIRCLPAIVNDAVYFTSDDGSLYSVNPETGTKIWAFYIGNDIQRVLPDLTNPPGDIYWDYMQSSPCVNKGVVYVGSGDSCLYAVDAKKGSLKWKVKTGGIIRSTPFYYEDMVYVGSFDGYIYAFNTTDGTKAWAFDTHGSEYKHVQPSPRVVDGILYCGARNPFFYAIDAKTGKEIWKHSFDFSWVESSAAVADGKVYVGSSDLRIIHSFDAKNGNVNWSSKVKGDTWSSPCYNNGTIYIGLASYGSRADTLTGGGILAINAADGAEKWKVDCGTSAFIGGVVSSPVVNDDVVFYGSLDGKVYAVKNK